MSRGSIGTAIWSAARQQAWMTVKRKYSSGGGISTLVTLAIVLVVLWFVRDVDFGDQIGASAFLLAGFLAFSVIAAAVMTVAAEVQTEREDGTLLRAKAVPHGMTGHLIAKLLVVPVDAMLPIIPTLVAVAIFLPEAVPDRVLDWLLLIVVLLLAIAAMMPWGAVLGSIFRSMMGLAWSIMGIYVLAGISGIFYPITALPNWLQWIAQATPVYWIGLGIRAVMMPPEGALVEIGESYRVVLTIVVLALWTLIGLVLAPIVLRRMARRQSGSTVAAARERMLSRGY